MGGPPVRAGAAIWALTAGEWTATSEGCIVLACGCVLGAWLERYPRR